MTTDYAALGRASLERLHAATGRARQLQLEELEHILGCNAASAYGRRYGFSAIRSVEDYQRRVPLTCHEDYEPYVERLLAGERAQLTCAEPVYYAITSGSTGVPKYVPVTAEDMLVHYNGIYAGVFGMVREYYAQEQPEALFGKIFQVGEFARTRLPGGQMCGARSASLYQWLDRDGGFDASDYCVPKEVLFPDRVEDLTYAKLRFALAERGLTAIHGVFLHRVVGVLDYARENWELLLHDMEHGTVDAASGLSGPWRRKLEGWLGPDPARAAQLRALRPDAEPEDMVRRLWPGMRYIVGVGGENFPVYTRAMEQYAPDVPIHHFIYGASEGFISIAAGLGVPDAYILLSYAGFFEFLPVDAPECSRPLTVGELEPGRKYELVITNHSGLYRYRMQDVLEVSGFYGQSPIFRFCYRINQVLNVADEKLNTEQLREALDMFRRRTGRRSAAFCAQEDFSVRPGRYLVYVEAQPLENAAQIMDECLGRASFGYQSCRSMGDIGPARVRFLPPGSFQSYERLLAANGRTMTQYKPVQILDSEDKRRFFAAEADSLVR